MNLNDIVYGAFQNLWIRGIAFGGLTVAVDLFTHKFFGETNYHLSGAITATIARAIDIASTIPMIRLMNQREFRDLGLQEVVKEGCPLHKPHPTMREYLSRTIPLSLLSIGLGTYFPPVGYVYLASTPLIYTNNTGIRRKVEGIIDAE